MENCSCSDIKEEIKCEHNNRKFHPVESIVAALLLICWGVLFISMLVLGPPETLGYVWVPIEWSQEHNVLSWIIFCVISFILLQMLVLINSTLLFFIKRREEIAETKQTMCVIEEFLSKAESVVKEQCEEQDKKHKTNGE